MSNETGSSAFLDVCGWLSDLLSWIRTYASMISDSGEEQFMSKSRNSEAQIIAA
jgi:hypothetical protein